MWLLPLLLPLLHILPQILTCTIQTYPPPSFTLNAENQNTTTLTNTTLILNTNSEIGSWSAALNYTNLSTPWRFYFVFMLTNCGGPQLQSCVGDGFSFILHNSPLGTAYLGPQGSYLGCCPASSLSVKFNFFGPCNPIPKPFLTLDSQYSVLYVGTPPPGLNFPINISTCNVSHEAMIDYDGRFLSVYLENMETPWIYYEVNLTSMIPLKDSELGYVTWGISDAGSIISFSLSNVSSHLDCIFPKPQCDLMPNFNCTCDGNCVATDFVVSTSQSLSSGTYTITGEVNIIQTLTISNTIISTGPLTISPTATLNITDSNVIINGNLNINSSNSSLFITLSESNELHGTPPPFLSVMGCSFLNGNLILLGQTPKNSLLVSTKCYSGVFTNIETKIPSPQGCLNNMNLIYNSTGVWVVFGDVCEGGGGVGFLLEIIGWSVGGGILLFGLVFGVVWYIRREKRTTKAIKQMRGGISREITK